MLAALVLRRQQQRQLLAACTAAAQPHARGGRRAHLVEAAGGCRQAVRAGVVQRALLRGWEAVVRQSELHRGRVHPVGRLP